MGGRFVGTFLLRYTTADRLLALYALVCGALAAVAVLGSGMVVLYALGGLGFFMSIMFPTIFSLGIDRKSTRLNSSHVKKSYAVFCLKKKKNKNRMYIELV